MLPKEHEAGRVCPVSKAPPSPLSIELTSGAPLLQAPEGRQAEHPHLQLQDPQQQLPSSSQWHSQHSGSQRVHEPAPICHSWRHAVSPSSTCSVCPTCMAASSCKGQCCNVSSCFSGPRVRASTMPASTTVYVRAKPVVHALGIANSVSLYWRYFRCHTAVLRIMARQFALVKVIWTTNCRASSAALRQLAAGQFLSLVWGIYGESTAYHIFLNLCLCADSTTPPWQSMWWALPSTSACLRRD